MNEMPSAIVHGWGKLVATLYVPKDSTMPVSCSSGFVHDCQKTRLKCHENRR